jgi:ribonuclease E
MEISRQKLRSSNIGNSDDACPTCSGTGHIKSLSSQSISLVRMLEEEAIKNDKSLTVYLPVRLATYLLNEKRELIQAIEERNSLNIKIVPDPEIEATSYLVDRDNLTKEAFKASLNTKISPKDNKTIEQTNYSHQPALVSSVTPKTQPPKPKYNNLNDKKETGVLKNIINKVKSIFTTEEKKVYKHRQTNGKRRFSKNYYNKYKSYNRKKNLRKKNNTSNKNQNTA